MCISANGWWRESRKHQPALIEWQHIWMPHNMWDNEHSIGLDISSRLAFLNFVIALLLRKCHTSWGNSKFHFKDRDHVSQGGSCLLSNRAPSNSELADIDLAMDKAGFWEISDGPLRMKGSFPLHGRQYQMVSIDNYCAIGLCMEMYQRRLYWMRLFEDRVATMDCNSLDPDRER